MKSTAGCLFCVRRAAQSVKIPEARENSTESFGQMTCHVFCEHTALLYRKL